MKFITLHLYSLIQCLLRYSAGYHIKFKFQMTFNVTKTFQVGVLIHIEGISHNRLDHYLQLFNFSLHMYRILTIKIMTTPTILTKASLFNFSLHMYLTLTIKIMTISTILTEASLFNFSLHMYLIQIIKIMTRSRSRYI